MKDKKTVQAMKLSASFIFIVIFTLSGLANAAYGQKTIIWYTMEKAQKLAQKNNKKVIVFAGANWCIYCQKMDEEVFPKERVIDSLNTYFYGVRVNIDSRAPIVFNGKTITAVHFARMHNIRATPTFIFLNSDGAVLGAQPGFIPAKIFSRLLGYVGSNAYKQMEFGTYLANRTSK